MRLDEKKFRARRFRFSLDENYKLDRIRDSGKTKSEHNINALIAILISVIILVIAFIVPAVLQFARDRARNDACTWAKKSVTAMRQASNGGSISDGTMFVVKSKGNYYLFWFDITAPDDMQNLVEIDKPEKYPMPVNVKESKKIKYPFSEPPIRLNENKDVVILDELQVLSGYEIVPYESVEFSKPNDVEVFELKYKN